MADFDLLVTGVDCATTVSAPSLVFTAIEVEEPQREPGGGGEVERKRRNRISLDAWLELQGVKPERQEGAPKDKPKGPKRKPLVEAMGIEPVADSILIPLSQYDRVLRSVETADFQRFAQRRARELEKRRRIEQAQQEEEIAVFLMMMAAA